MKTKLIAMAFAAGLGVAFTVQAKLPPPPPADPVAVEAKKKAAAEAAEKAKAAMGAAQERAVKNYQGNMKKAGKPVPKPTPIAAAPAAPAKAAAPAKPADKAPAKKS